MIQKAVTRQILCNTGDMPAQCILHTHQYRWVPTMSDTIVNIFNPHRLAWWHNFGCNSRLCAELPIVWNSEAFSNDGQMELFQICFFHRNLNVYGFFIKTIFSPSTYMQFKPILNYYMHPCPNLKTLFASCTISYHNWTILEELLPFKIQLWQFYTYIL